MENELTLQEIQKCSLEVLIKFDEICKNHGFKYWLSYGTLIGAIRHNGFIPWDDDIDVMMPRNDFNEFVKYALNNQEKLYPFKLHNRSNTKNYWYGIPRFSNMEYQYIVDDKYEQPFDIGVFIDIYPLDNYGNTEKDAEYIFKHCRHMNRQFDWYVNSASQGNFLRTFVKRILHLWMRIIKGDNYPQIIDDEIEEFIKENTTENDRYVGMIAFAGKIVLYERNQMHDFDVTRHDFSGETFFIPISYDYVLRQSFGDYMKLPSEDQRHPSHNYRVVRRNQLLRRG